MKVSSPHTPCDIPAISNISAFREGLIQSHTQQINPIVERTNKEIHLPTQTVLEKIRSFSLHINY